MSFENTTVSVQGFKRAAGIAAFCLCLLPAASRAAAVPDAGGLFDGRKGGVLNYSALRSGSSPAPAVPAASAVPTPLKSAPVALKSLSPRYRLADQNGLYGGIFWTGDQSGGAGWADYVFTHVLRLKGAMHQTVGEIECRIGIRVDDSRRALSQVTLDAQRTRGVSYAEAEVVQVYWNAQGEMEAEIRVYVNRKAHFTLRVTPRTLSTLPSESDPYVTNVVL